MNEEYDNEQLEKLLHGIIDDDIIDNAPKDSCCFKFDLSSVKLPENLVVCMQNLSVNVNVDCLARTINNINKSVRYVGMSDFKSEQKYLVIDNYMRYRHEILHNLSMKCVNLSMHETDQKFSEIFDIKSDRTPDKIVVEDKNVLIIETTATLNITKSFITKGKEDEGFESKYQREITELKNLGYFVKYVVLIFDMKIIGNNSFKEQLLQICEFKQTEFNSEAYHNLLIIKNMFANTAIEIMKQFGEEITNLLSIRVNLKPIIPKNLEFSFAEGKTCYNEYKRSFIGTNIYNKLTASWPILPYVLNKSNLNKEKKIVLQFDYMKNRFDFVCSEEGMFESEMLNCLIYNNKSSVIRTMKRVVSGAEIPSEKADIEFFDTMSSGPDFFTSIEIEQSEHANTKEFENNSISFDYSKYLGEDFYKNKKHKLEDPNYEQVLINQCLEMYNTDNTEIDLDNIIKYLHKKPFSSNVLSKNTFKKAVSDYVLKMTQYNDEIQSINIKMHQKKPFIYPIVDHTIVKKLSYKLPPSRAINALKNLKTGGYTNLIIDRISAENFVWGTRPKEFNSVQISELKKLSELNVELYNEQIRLKKQENLEKLPKLHQHESLKHFIVKLKLQNKAVKDCGASIKKELSMTKLPLKKGKSRFYNLYHEEMVHFKSKKSPSTYKGVGNINFKNLDDTFQRFKLFLKSPTLNTDKDDVLDDFISDDVSLLKMLKIDHMKNIKEKLSYLKGTMLYSVCEFVSRFCHSLCYLSQTGFNGDIVTADNLGYDSCILIVKGGKKVFKTKKSKLFRIFYPLPCDLIDWYNNPKFSNSADFCFYDNNCFIMTPWQNLDETLMNDGLTFLHRTFSYILMCHEPEPQIALDKTVFNVLLALHARRKTEEMLHNLRYVSVNCISCASKVEEMLPTLAGFNYDFFQAYIRSSLSENFENFAYELLNFNNEKKLPIDHFKRIGLKALIGGSLIESYEDLTLTIYSTFLMSKSPTTQSLEQKSNLKSMLETDVLHDEESDNSPNIQQKLNGMPFDNFNDEWNRLFCSDFNYDSKYCNLLGKFSNDYIKNVTNKGELTNEWVKIVDNGWDEFSNTKGLRGYKSDNFFNKKGYFIVYSKVLEDENYASIIHNLLLSNDDDFNKRKQLNKLNLKYKEHLGCQELDEIIMHVVDKKQRGGSREIFVMDLETKINQQVIEKYLQFLCKKVPNEAISIPSNKRLQHIHATVFEKFKTEEGKTYNLSFDCRKWAPRSVLNKFIDFIIGMSGVLPDSFITHFLNFFSKMYDKKIYTKEYIYDMMVGNLETKKLAQSKLVKCSKNDKGYYFKMSYSWVMGIFNYMSSFMHVMNQIHAGHIIYKITSMVENAPAILHMNAHSDDSCGKIQTISEISMRKSMIIYEFLLKKANHMLSDKKCNISNKYFEFLSVLYIDNTLLSLLTKISGSFSFHPTDKGYCGDMNESYSKCIEIISAGGTFEQAYLAMKISSHSIYKFYFNQNPNKKDYDLPIQLLGMPDSHPLSILLTGSDSDMIRLMCKNEKSFSIYDNVIKCITGTQAQELSVLPGLAVLPNIKVPDKLIMQRNIIGSKSLTDDLKWIIMNTKLNNTALRLLRYGNQLYDQSFVASLIDETITRRISRAYYFRSGEVVNTIYGKKSYKTIKKCIQMLIFAINRNEKFGKDNIYELVETEKEFYDKIYENFMSNCTIEQKTDINMYKLMNMEIFELMFSLDKLIYKEENVVQFNKTCKPIHINMQKTILPTSDEFSPSNLTTWICFKNYRWLIPIGDDYKNKYEQIKIFLERHDINIDLIKPSWLYNFLEKYKKRYVKEYFIYTNMPHNIRDISNYRDLMQYLAHNSFKNKFIKGIVLPFNETSTQSLPSLFKNVFNKIELKTIDLLSFCCSIINNDDYKKLLEILEMNGKVINCKSNNIIDLLQEIMNLYTFKPYISPFIIPHAVALFKTINEEKITVSDLDNSYYYCFLKNQKMINNIWLGVGRLLIHMPNINIELELKNQEINKLTCDKQQHTLSQPELSYIDSVLISAGIKKLESHFKNIEVSDWEKISIGLSPGGLITIDKTRNLISSIKSFHSVKFIKNDIMGSNHEHLRLNNDMSYSLKTGNEIEGHRKRTINVYKTDPTSIYATMNELLTNDKNKSIMDNLGEIPDKYLKMIIGETSGITMSISLTKLLSVHRASKLFFMMQKLVKSGMLSESYKKNRKHIYPGQHGGLLAAMIDFKQLEPNFRFEPTNVLSREMMLLKSSQPDVFVSNLIDNIEVRFKQLYTNDEKDIIQQQIEKIWEVENKTEQSEKILSLLMTWGYIGVMGSINEINFIKSVNNLKQFRNYPVENLYKKINYDGLRSVLSSIYKSATQSNYFDERTTKPLICRSLMDFKKTIISYVHSYMLNSGKGKSSVLVLIPNFEIIKIFNTLTRLFLNPDYLDSLNKELENEPITSTIKLESTSVKDLIITIETMINCITIDSLTEDAEYDNKKLISHENCIQPYLKTQNLLKDTIVGYSTIRAYHQGVISRDQRKSIVTHKLYKIKNNYFDVNIIEGCLSKYKQDFNKFMWVNGRFDEDFYDDDDYYDINIELISTEPDAESYQDLIEENLKPSYSRKIKVWDKYRNLVNAERVYAMFYTIFDSKRRPEILSRIRPCADTIIIYTNLYIDDIIECNSNNVKLFNNNNQTWFNKSIIDPESCFYYVIDTKEINITMWELVLGSKHVHLEHLIEEKKNTPCQVILNSNGLLETYDKYSTLEEKLEQLERTVECKRNPKLDHEAKSEVTNEHNKRKIDTEIEALRWEGFSEDFLTDIRTKLKSYHEKFDFDISKIIKNYIDGKKMSEIVKSGMKAEILNILKKLDDFNKATKIFEVADIFSVGRNSESDQKNKSLKDNHFRAEIECLSEGLMNKVLSGRLRVSKFMKKTFRKHLITMVQWIKNTKENKEAKSFLIDICYLIINDAYEDENNNDDWMFEDIHKKTLNYIVEDEEDSDDESMLSTYSNDEKIGRLYYDF